MTYENSQQTRNGIIGLFLGVVMLCFVLLLAVFMISILVNLAPVLSFLIAVGGAIWYFQAKTEHYKLRAMTTVAIGLGGMLLFGIIF